ncbi:ADP-ribosylglycohydrolase [Parapedobacter composti]|uniref:ADP-ribosylglycohydrolase n=1 Tax=Parapedobacter composti TaxID=623281 RepID=A0A1I1KUI9_9SPHI|nr:ADP-ribosylglycohydrolase family protein [Parapedobacter composti]SFC64466.1 ADP-ribosylglycohydrolase [Parapedobacter composti]
MKARKLHGLAVIAFLCSLKIGSPAAKDTVNDKLTISRKALFDKIKGGWAGQTIGVSFGSYTEFKYNGTFIQDYQTIPWSDGQMKKLMDDWPDLFDDIYMDLTFVDVIERLGVNAPVDSFASAFAHAGYGLWHANQAARYNILNGIAAPASGHWLNNPHADDIDYQIEADFAGLMNPGMPNSASAISDKVGHIMTYGDGWYGGVFIGAMYSLAFIHDDIEKVINEALRTVPEQSTFHQCIADVIRWHKKYPRDWKRTWFEIQQKWTEEVGCPEGVFSPLNIDAKVNAAYVVAGLLYGRGDFALTMEIATRMGQDSDCNPSSAAGILGTIVGYDGIPDYWKKGLENIEDVVFKYTQMSLNTVYQTSYQHALKMIAQEGGSVGEDVVVIKKQVPQAVRYEKSFEGVFPISKTEVHQNINNELSFEFEGTGFVLRGSANKNSGQREEHVFVAECYINGAKVEEAKLPTEFRTRRYELFWKYQLPKGKHRVKIVVRNPSPGHHVRAWDYIVYSDEPANGIHEHLQ